MRNIPAALLAHLKSRYRSTCYCWAIKPARGDWEGYTSLDRDLTLPAYTDAPSNVPALTYRHAGGVGATAIPSRLNLGKTGIEVGLLAFDRASLLRGFYTGAQYEVFTVNYLNTSQGRDVISSGKLGAVTVGEVEAQIELIEWGALAEMAIGRTCTAHCDVGLYPGERFGTGRCRNVTLNDGPLRANWGSAGEVESVTDAHTLRVSYSTSTAVSGAALPGAFSSRLVEGDLAFDDADGGDNAGLERAVKSATVLSPGLVDLVLHEDLPFLPSPGDATVLYAGCRRTAEDCQAFDNFDNFQGFPVVPLKSGVTRRKEEN